MSARVHLRLVGQEEALPSDGCAQILLDVGACSHHGLHARVEKAQGVAARRLGLVHGQVSPLHQLVDADLLPAKQGNADARRIVIVVTRQVVGAVEQLDDLLADDPALAGRLLGPLAEVLEHDHEFVAPETGNRIPLAHAAAQPLADLLQQAIAHVVPERVVERLEIVEIDEQQRALALAAHARRDGYPQTIVQQAAVRQAGQRVIEREMPDLFLCRLVRAHVGERRHVVGHHAVAIPDRGNRQPLREDLAILAAIPDLALPDAVAFDALAHRCVEARVVPSRTEQFRRLTDALVGGVACDVGERLVDAQDDGIGIGDEHALLGLESGGGDPFPLFGLLALGNVARHDDDACRLTLPVPENASGRRHVADAAIVTHQAILDLLAPASLGRLPEYPLHPLAVLGMDVGKRVAATQIPGIAEKLPIRRAVVKSLALQIEDGDVLANAFRNQSEELLLFAQAGFQLLPCRNVLGRADAAQRLALLVELHLRPLRYPPCRLAKDEAQLVVERLAPEGGGGGLLQGVAVVGVDARHEGVQAADRSCGKTQDATGFGRHVYPAADQVVDPATDVGNCLRAVEIGFACLQFRGPLGEIAGQATDVIDPALVRAHQKDDQEQGHKAASALHQTMHHGRSGWRRRQPGPCIADHEADDREHGQRGQNGRCTQAKQPAAHQDQQRIGDDQQGAQTTEERRNPGHGNPGSPDENRLRGSLTAGRQEAQGSQGDQRHERRPADPPRLVGHGQQNGRQGRRRRRQNRPGAVPQERL